MMADATPLLEEGRTPPQGGGWPGRRKATAMVLLSLVALTAMAVLGTAFQTAAAAAHEEVRNASMSSPSRQESKGANGGVPKEGGAGGSGGLLKASGEGDTSTSASNRVEFRKGDNLKSHLNSRAFNRNSNSSLTCDELILPFDSAHGGALDSGQMDNVRGARRMPKVLTNHATMTGLVEEDDYDFYQICVKTKRSFHLAVEVTHEWGNPDLYVSFSQPWPHVANSDIISANHIQERISVSTEADIVQEALLARSDQPAAVPSVIFLSVFGHKRSAYSISVSLAPLRGSAHDEFGQDDDDDNDDEDDGEDNFRLENEIDDENEDDDDMT